MADPEAQVEHARREGNEAANNRNEFIQCVKRSIKKVHECCTSPGLKREGRLFVKATAMHGVRRWWETKGKLQKRLWFLAVLLCFGMMITLICFNIDQYSKDNGSTKVTHHLESAGMQMPKITFCYNHPIKKSSIGQFNKSGEMTDEILRYIILSNKDPTKIGKTEKELELLDKRFHTDFIWYHRYERRNFSFGEFFKKTGFTCEDLFKNCSFDGVDIECCTDKTLFHTSLTEMGLCHSITINKTKQTTETDSGGLQLILDSQRDDTSPMPIEPKNIFNYPLSDGFRIFYEEPTKRTYISSHGIFVAPGQSLFSGIQKNEYVFKEGCSDEGVTIDSKRNNTVPEKKYKGRDCRSKCLAKAYNDHCNCAPLVFDINSEYPTCSPKQAFDCSNRDEVKKEHNFEENTGCKKCKPECKRYDYQSFNSYGGPLSLDAVRALKTINDSEVKIQKDYVVVTIYYRELSSIDYETVKPDLPSLFSNIGGSAGLCLGFSALTFIEIVVFLVKALWYGISYCRGCSGADRRNKKGLDYTANKELERAAIDRLKEQYTPPGYIAEVVRRDEINGNDVSVRTAVELEANDSIRGDAIAASVDPTVGTNGGQGLEPDAPNVNESGEGGNNVPEEEDLDVTQTTDQSVLNDTSRGDDQLEKTQSPTPPH